MSAHSQTDRTMAFAGILQALQLVKAIANNKPYDLDSYQASIKSIFSINADSVEEVYGDISGIRAGLRLIQSQLMRGNQKPDIELSRYLVTLLHLERKLNKRSDLMGILSTGIEKAIAQTTHYEITHENVIANLADTYSQTISTLTPRIMVNGDANLISTQAIANKIRTLLLAAMRSAILWRQCGGSRLSLLFGRSKLVDSATALLKK